MTKQEFAERFRHRMLGLLAEAWSLRRLPPSEYGRVIDGQQAGMMSLMEDMWNALNERKPDVSGNGTPQTAARPQTGQKAP